MNVGEERRFWIPENLAYAGRPGRPAGMLVFDVELISGELPQSKREKVMGRIKRGEVQFLVATDVAARGLDIPEVDLVVQMGAPKGSSRLIQRMGRSGHRLDTPSRAILVPGNRFEVLECRAALEAVYDDSLDGDPPGEGGA